MYKHDHAEYDNGMSFSFLLDPKSVNCFQQKRRKRLLEEAIFSVKWDVPAALGTLLGSNDGAEDCNGIFDPAPKRLAAGNSVVG